MNARAFSDLAARLNERDHAILHSLERFRLLDTRMVQRLHFSDHLTALAAARAAARTMQRLQCLGVTAALERRIGGVRKGSASYVWHLAAAGERLLRAARGQVQRRRFVEPGLTFVQHTLAVNDVAVSLLEADRKVDGFAVETLVTEPKNWRSYLGSGGETKWVKPDLTVVTTSADADGEYEEHAFLEVDLGTEHLPRIRAKCHVYAVYAATGRYQAEHGLFPAVVWLSAEPARRAALRAAVAATRGLPAGVFQVASPEEYLASLRGQPDSDTHGGQQAGAPA